MQFPADFYKTAPTVVGSTTDNGLACPYYTSKSCGFHEVTSGVIDNKRIFTGAGARPTPEIRQINFQCNDANLISQIDDLISNGESGKALLLQDINKPSFEITVQTYDELKRGNRIHTNIIKDTVNSIENGKDEAVFNAQGDFLSSLFKCVAVIDSCTYAAVECGAEKSKIENSQQYFGVETTS